MTTVRDQLLSGLKPAVVQQMKAESESGQLKTPVDFEEMSERVWNALRTNVQTAGALMFFKIKKADIEIVLHEALAELNIEEKKS